MANKKDETTETKKEDLGRLCPKCKTDSLIVQQEPAGEDDFTTTVHCHNCKELFI